MYARTSLLTTTLAALVVPIAWGDAITVDDHRYEDVYIIESERMYYVLLPETGEVKNVAKESIDEGSVFIADDATLRHDLFLRWKKQRGAEEPEAEEPDEAPPTPTAPEQKKPPVGTADLFQAFYQKELLERIAGFEGQYALWRSFTDYQRDAIRREILARHRAEQAASAQRAQQQQATVQQLEEQRAAIAEARQTQQQNIAQTVQREAERLMALQNDPSLNYSSLALAQARAAEDVFLSLSGYRGAYRARVLQEELEDQVAYDTRRANAHAGQIAAAGAAERMYYQRLLGALGEQEATLARVENQAQRQLRLSAKVAARVEMRNEIELTRLALLDEALTNNYQPQFNAERVRGWKANVPQKTDPFQISTDFWRITWKINRRERHGIFRVNIREALTGDILTSFSDQDDAYERVRILNRPGLFTLDIIVRGAISYEIEVAELQ